MIRVEQLEINVGPFSRGFHLITREIENKLSELNSIGSGICHVFIKHTSASLCINENADPTVRQDFESHFNQSIPENAPYYRHTYEGPDDMPAHLKTATIGNSIQVPITKGRLNLGTWQGIYLGEHRDHASSRKLVVTYYGS